MRGIRMVAAAAALVFVSAGVYVRAQGDGARAQGDAQPASGAAPSAAAVAPDQSRAARIVVEPARFDFGPILPGKAVTREFVIRNVGASDLSLESVATSCGCTVAEGYSKVVKPAGTTVLRVTLTAPAQPGKVVKSVLVKSNDPVKGTVELKVEATVVAGAAS